MKLYDTVTESATEAAKDMKKMLADTSDLSTRADIKLRMAVQAAWINWIQDTVLECGGRDEAKEPIYHAASSMIGAMVAELAVNFSKDGEAVAHNAAVILTESTMAVQECIEMTKGDDLMAVRIKTKP